MTNPTTDTVTQNESLQAENDSLKALLLQYREAALQNDAERRALQSKISETAAAKSYADMQAEELHFVKEHVTNLKQQAQAAAGRETELEKELSLSVSSMHQLEDVKAKYNHLLTQLSDVNEKLIELQSRQVQASQHAGRIAELESMLANAENEIESLKRNKEENDETDPA